MREGGFDRKSLVCGAVVLLLITGLSPVYAGFTFSESKAIESKTAETTRIDIRNPLDRESFLDKYDSSEIEERYRNHPYLRRHDQYNPIIKPTLVDGKEWDIVVPDDYPSIQQSVDNSEDGYRIFVRSGEYHENIDINWLSSITLHGESKETTIVDGDNLGTVIRIFEDADGINISGFTIKNSGDDNAGLNITSHYNIIQDNIIIDNSAGINLYFSSGNQIQGNLITDNAADGLWLRHSNGNNIIDNTIMKNDDNGIELSYFSLGTTIEDNTISDNNICGILLRESSLGNSVTGNNITNNDFGVKCIGVSDGNIFYHNRFIGNNQNAYDSSMDLWDYDSIGNFWDDYTGTDNDGNGIGDTPYIIPGGENKDYFPLMTMATMTVNSKQDRVDEVDDESRNIWVSTASSSLENGWDIIVPDDYQTIQAAVDHANPGDRIFVRSGIYHENVDISILGLTLHGENKDNTVIDGSGINHVVWVGRHADGFDFSGFTIRNGGNFFMGCISGLMLHGLRIMFLKSVT